MSGDEIRARISENNKRIAAATNPTRFTLNREIAVLLEENRKLQSLCKHEWDELGYCIYCDKERV